MNAPAMRAIQFDGTNAAAVKAFGEGRITDAHARTGALLWAETRSGGTLVRPTDWIVRGAGKGLAVFSNASFRAMEKKGGLDAPKRT